MTLTKKRSTISNLFWSFLTQGGVEVVRFIVAIILARLLVPADYGIMAIVGIFTGFSNVFIQFTFSPVIVQNRDLDRKDIHTIFWLNLTVGTFVAIVFVLSGSFLAQFYYQPVLKGLVALAGLQVIVASISVIQRALQEKNHNFKTIGVVRFAAALLSSIIAIILAYNNFGVWALAIHMFLLVLFECLGLFMLSKWYPKLIFSSNTFQKIKRMTSSLVLERSFGHLTESMDKFILGKFSSVSDLGLYSRSYGFLLFPLRNISQVISQVMLPKVSENKHNLKNIKVLYINSLNTILLIVFPLMLMIFLIPNAVVYLIFGDKWMGMVPYLNILSFCGILSSIIVLTQSFFVGYGDHKRLNKITLIEKPLFVIMILCGFIINGSIGLTFGILVASILAVLLRQYHIFKILNINLISQNIVFFKCLLIGLISYFLYSYLIIDKINYVTIFILSSFFLSIYYIVSFLLKKGFMNNLKKLNKI